MAKAPRPIPEGSKKPEPPPAPPRRLGYNPPPPNADEPPVSVPPAPPSSESDDLVFVVAGSCVQGYCDCRHFHGQVIRSGSKDWPPRHLECHCYLRRTIELRERSLESKVEYLIGQVALLSAKLDGLEKKAARLERHMVDARHP